MPPTRRHRIARRRLFVFGGAGLILTLLGYLAGTLLAPTPATSATLVLPVEEEFAAATVDFPTYGAAAVGALGYPGLLGQSGRTDPVPMASITKVITALVVLDAHPLGIGEAGPAITMTAADAELYGSYLAQNGTVSPVRVGMQFTQRDLLELTLVKSANNYTMSMVLWAFGSNDAFVHAARAWLDRHGLSAVVVNEPTGLDRGNIATAADLVELARIALADPVVAEIVALRAADLPQLGLLPNTNALVGTHGVDGIKTGTLDDFGASLLFSADHRIGEHTVTVIGVVLGGPDHHQIDDDIVKLLGTVLAGFHEVEVAADGESFGVYRTIWGATSNAVADRRVTVLVWGDTPLAAVATVEPVQVGEAGDRVGDVVFSAGESTVTVRLELDSDIEGPGPWWRLSNPAALF